MNSQHSGTELHMKFNYILYIHYILIHSEVPYFKLAFDNIVLYNNFLEATQYIYHVKELIGLKRYLYLSV